MLLPESVRWIEHKHFQKKILSDKAVHGIIKRAINANKVADNAWIENIILAECKVTIKNRQDAPKLKAVNAQLPVEKRLSGIEQFTDEPKKLSPVESDGFLTLYLPQLPEYQRCSKYVRFVIRYLGYDCEIQVHPKIFESFAQEVSNLDSLRATVSGKIEETPHGFLMSKARLDWPRASAKSNRPASRA